MNDISYGTAACKEDIRLSVWDGSDDYEDIKVGDVLTITYYEHDGSLGLSKDGVEFCCSHAERKCFKEKWDHREG